MKKIWVFILGTITGIALFFVISLLITKFPTSTSLSSDNGVTMFPEAGDCLSEKSFKVSQAFDNETALATELSDVIGEHEFYSGITVLFFCEGKNFYDDEIIRVPKGKCARQIGIYKYSTKIGDRKTVPIVEIMD